MGKIIGITGGIGSGKSVVSRIVRLNGFGVYDCDREAKILMATDPQLKESLIRLLGEEAFPGGELDRAYVASRIFTDKGLLADVNLLVHRAVRDDFMRKANADRKGRYFCESAILASSGLMAVCEEVWLVDAPREVRVKRVIARNGLPKADILKRMEVQENEFSSMPQAIRIENDDHHQILPQILDLLHQH